MIPDHKEVLKLAAQIDAAEKTLDELKEKWNSMFTLVPVATFKEAVMPPQRDYEYANKVVALLENSPSTVFTIAAIDRSLGEGDITKTSRTVNRLASRGKIENPGRGSYRAKQRIDAEGVAA